jgi:hypothetical protein
MARRSASRFAVRRVFAPARRVPSRCVRCPCFARQGGGLPFGAGAASRAWREVWREGRRAALPERSEGGGGRRVGGLAFGKARTGFCSLSGMDLFL